MMELNRVRPEVTDDRQELSVFVSLSVVVHVMMGCEMGREEISAPTSEYYE